MRILKVLIVVVVLLGSLFYYVAYWPLRDRHPVPHPSTGVLAITGARIYTSPDAQVIPQGTIVIRDGKIAAAGDQAAVPADAQLLPCNGCVVTAGFWNAHVHFTQRK